MDINAAHYLGEQLSWYDMTGITTWIVLLILGVVLGLYMIFNDAEPVPWPITLVVVTILVPLAWVIVSFGQNTMLGTTLMEIRQVEQTLHTHEDLVPNPALVRLNDNKELLVNAMKDTGGFGEYESILDDAVEVSKQHRYTRDPYKQFYVVSTYKSCFKTDQVDEKMLDAISVFPFSIRQVEDIWEKQSFKHGVDNPACYARNFVKNLD